MGYRSQTGSRRSAGRKYQKTQHERAKTKTERNRSGRHLQEAAALSSKEVVERTLSSLDRLGNQTFALSPFSQYFDDWLLNVRGVLSEFESRTDISVDAQFVNERSEILATVERELAEKRLNEATLEETAKTLSENNHLLAQADADYAARNRELRLKRDGEINLLTRNVNDQEKELERTGQMKTSFFGSFTKKVKARKEAETTQKLNAAKKELELVMQNFAVEQETLHDEYEKRKQAITEKVQRLEKEVENLEQDGSQEPRQAACKALINSVNALLQRKKSMQ